LKSSDKDAVNSDTIKNSASFEIQELENGNKNPEMEPKEIKNMDKEELWDQIGFHKLLAGFWYNITYTLIGILLSATLMGALMNMFYPFPESLGYKQMVWQTFSVVFLAFDLGTGMVMDRYIAKENITNPRKMMKYIQYFIWYQAITGLIQITAISIYALYFVPDSNKAYAVYLMLICGSTQYPGFLGVFRNVLDSLQHYNKTQLLNFLTGTLFQRLTEIGFVYLGKLYGQAHPEVGEILGVSIGGMIGLYVDDFFAMLVSAKFFAGVMEDYGIRPIDCLRVDFTWEEVKEPFLYGIKTGIPGLINSTLGFINFTLWVNYLPQYTTYATLAAIGTSIPNVMTWFGTPRISALLSESYQNDKKDLTRYYIGQYVRFHAEIQGFFVPLLLIVSTVLPIAWNVMGMVNYLPAIIFVVPGLVLRIVTPYLGIPNQLQYAIGKPNFAIITSLLNNIMNTIFLLGTIVWWNIPEKNVGAIPWLYVCYTLPFGVLFSALNYWFVNKKILTLKIPFKQIFFGFVIPAFLTYGATYLGKILIFDNLFPKFGFYVAAIVSVAIFLVAILGVFFPFSALFGGWDDENLAEFEKAAYMAGPSKMFAIPVFKLVNWACKKSKYHNKFAPDMETIERQARELLMIKLANREEFQEEKK